MALTTQSEVGRIRTLVLKRPEEAFGDAARVSAEWQALNYLDEPEFAAAMVEHEALVRLFESFDIDIRYLPASEAVGMDSIYVRDAAIVCDAGAILCRMGKAARAGEPAACAAAVGAETPAELRAIEAPGTLEGGDVAWLDTRTLAVGRGYRSNAAGIAQLHTLLPEDVTLLEAGLPHWQGPDDVFHLMSMLSPIDDDLLLVYSPLLPVPFREALLERGFQLIDVAPEEFATMGCNVLTVEPRGWVMLAGNRFNGARPETAGAQVHVYRGEEISRKGCGGPTCLTRPLLREL